MTQSVSRVIREKNGELWIKEDTLNFPHFNAFFTRAPKRPYKVTYSLNRKGHFTAYYHKYVNLICLTRRGRTCQELAICFLPAAWDGLRVSRTVTPMRGTRG